MTDARKVLTPQLKLDSGESDLILVDLGRGQNRTGASCFAQVFGKVGAVPADLDDAEDLKAFFAVVQGLNGDDKILAYHDRADGGLFATVVEMAFAAHSAPGSSANSAAARPSSASASRSMEISTPQCAAKG